MSDATTAPEATPAPAAPIAATIPTPTASEPDWLPKRLEQAKATIAKAKALEESQKSELQKLNERIAALEPTAKKAADYEQVIAKHADAELAKLTDEQRAAVLAIAGDDKARALSTVEALRPTWVKAAPAAPAPPPPPANTAAATAAPTGGLVPTVNHKATWEALKATNPMYAAQYLRAHSADIFPPT
jgi:translation initiation factor IF-2